MTVGLRMPRFPTFNVEPHPAPQSYPPGRQPRRGRSPRAEQVGPNDLPTLGPPPPPPPPPKPTELERIRCARAHSSLAASCEQNVLDMYVCRCFARMYRTQCNAILDNTKQHIEPALPKGAATDDAGAADVDHTAAAAATRWPHASAQQSFAELSC